MDVYVALHDPAKGGPGDQSWVLGAFSSEDRAQRACQEDADAEAGVTGRPVVPLEWANGEAEAADATRYAVVMVCLDVAV